MIEDTGINRNIMECKDICVWVFLPPGFCINRNIMECKVWSFDVYCFGIGVLIETLWNVKKTVVAVIGSLNKY